MKTSRYTEPQILAILRQAEGGMPVAQLCREHGMSNASFYKWRAKYGGMDWSCRVFVPLRVLVYATLRSKATGLFPPNAEWRRRGL